MGHGTTALKYALPMMMCAFAPRLAKAGAEAAVYGGPHDIAEDWARIIGWSLAALSAGLILYTLIFRRNRLMEPQSKWLLFLGVCVAPVPISFLSTAVGLEQSKRVDFCSSCHVMEPFIEDMRDPDSDTLAAVHFRNRYIPHEQCYNCHSDYGIFGTAEAKLAGLRHVWKESTKTYELPIKIHKPYNYTICLNCHGQAAPFLEYEDHHDAVKSVLAGEASCIECHDEIHPPREDRSE
jgi:cytochrome c nitrite reductase small subunit